MILDSLILENFGLYKGRQEANLTPEKGRPVILFGGLNGGGKTTILDGLQLCLYGSKARLLSRAGIPYKKYLQQAIHRGSDPHDGASLSVRFRRVIEGDTKTYEVTRKWRMGDSGIEEHLSVQRDGAADEVLTENWADQIEGYLPSSIAHLFFFDGEQISELAESDKAAEILRTAIHSLLGLDILDRLGGDLKVLERRKRSEIVDEKTARKLAVLGKELELADEKLAKSIVDRARLTNEVSLSSKRVEEATNKFRLEGGEVFERRHELESALRELENEREEVLGRLKAIAAGAAPLLLLESKLADLNRLLENDRSIRRARVVVDGIAERDERLMAAMLKHSKVSHPTCRILGQWLAEDRAGIEKLAGEKAALDASDSLGPEVIYMQASVLPDIQRDIQHELSKLEILDNRLSDAQAKLEQVPAADVVATLQKKMEDARQEHNRISVEYASAKIAVDANDRHREHLKREIDSLGLANIDQRFAQEDCQRLLRHSERVRTTLEAFRTAFVEKHVHRLNGFIKESFQLLLRKHKLITDLTIDPVDFTVSLRGRDGLPLPFNRLSAGERQLLATSLLWGLARAAGRPIPTVIDTPLGRLDSSHRHHLVERYFPHASHQVILLSTDEEIAEEYHDGIKPAVAREFCLSYDDEAGRTTILSNSYFKPNEATG